MQKNEALAGRPGPATTQSQDRFSTDEAVQPVANRNGEQLLPAVAAVPNRSEDRYVSECTVIVLAVMKDYIVHRAHRTFPRAPSNLEDTVALLSDATRRETYTEEVIIKILHKFDLENRAQVETLVYNVPIDNRLPEIFEGVVLECLRDAAGPLFWSRLVAVFAFAGRLAIVCMEAEVSHHVWSITNILKKVITDNMRPEIERRGSWAAFVMHFNNTELQPQFQTQSGLRNLWTQIVTAMGSSLTIGTQQNEAAEVQSPSSPLTVNLFGPLATSVNTLMGFLIRP